MLPAVLAFGAVAYLFSRPANAQEPNPQPNTNGLDVSEIIVTAVNYEVDTMARTAWAEARGAKEDDPRTPLHDGMQAVINVIMNRYKLSRSRPAGLWWGNTPAEICMRRFGSSYQFECWAPSTAIRNGIRNDLRNDRDYQHAYQLAKAAYAGTLPDITRGATHYYNPKKVSPAWAKALPKTIVIASHDFHVERV